MSWLVTAIAVTSAVVSARASYVGGKTQDRLVI